MVVKRQCAFCAGEIEPGRGLMFVKRDGSVFYFCSGTCRKHQITYHRVGHRLKWTRAHSLRKLSTRVSTAIPKRAAKPSSAPPKDAPAAPLPAEPVPPAAPAPDTEPASSPSTPDAPPASTAKGSGKVPRPRTPRKPPSAASEKKSPPA